MKSRGGKKGKITTSHSDPTHPLYTGAAASSHGLALFIAEQQLGVKRQTNKHLRWRLFWFLAQLRAAAQTVGVIKAALLLFIVSVVMTAAVAQ